MSENPFGQRFWKHSGYLLKIRNEKRNFALRSKLLLQVEEINEAN